MKKQHSVIKSKYRLDIIVISVIIAVSLLLLLILNISKKEGAVAVVEIDGNTVAKYPLSTSGEYPLNGGTNVLIIEDGTACVCYSSCPDHTCERTGKVRYVGQTIVCLPNRVSITIKGGADNGVDLVS